MSIVSHSLLKRPHLGIAPAQTQQFLVPTALHDLAVLEHQDEVGVTDRAHAVRHEQRRAAAHLAAKFALGRLHFDGHGVAKNFTDAARLFRAAADLNPKDKLPGIYIDRCLHLKENPPEGEWTGVWVMKTK